MTKERQGKVVAIHFFRILPNVDHDSNYTCGLLKDFTFTHQDTKPFTADANCNQLLWTYA